MTDISTNNSNLNSVLLQGNVYYGVTFRKEGGVEKEGARKRNLVLNSTTKGLSEIRLNND